MMLYHVHDIAELPFARFWRAMILCLYANPTSTRVHDKAYMDIPMIHLQQDIESRYHKETYNRVTYNVIG